MSSRLEEIISHKRTTLAALEDRATALRKNALSRNDFRNFRNALLSAELTLIAEVKKASPSAGTICEDFNPEAQAAIYQQAGAHAISVLTEEKFFQGHLDHLKSIRDTCDLPLLRKDFTIHRNQLYESCAEGADAILLIVAALTKNELHDLYNEACDLQLDVLVETHDLREMDAALDLGATIIGINNRNLATFEVTLETTMQLAEEVPEDVILVSESGIKTRDDVLRLRSAGANSILVGETLMRTDNPAALINELLRPPIL